MSSLEQRVTRLETDNAVVKKEVKQAAKSAEEAKSTAQSQVIPSEEAEKKSFFEKLATKLKTQETLAQGPPDRSGYMESNPSQPPPFEVREILGNPTKIKKSLNPRIEQVHYYTGDLDADGKMESGFINFYRDRVVSFKSAPRTCNQ